MLSFHALISPLSRVGPHPSAFATCSPVVSHIRTHTCMMSSAIVVRAIRSCVKSDRRLSLLVGAPCLVGFFPCLDSSLPPRSRGCVVVARSFLFRFLTCPSLCNSHLVGALCSVAFLHVSTRPSLCSLQRVSALLSVTFFPYHDSSLPLQSTRCPLFGCSLSGPSSTRSPSCGGVPWPHPFIPAPCPAICHMRWDPLIHLSTSCT